MTLAWALALSCFCTYVLIVAVSRVTITSGHTLIYCIRQHFVAALAIFMIAGLMATVASSVIGVMGIAADVLQQLTSQETGSAGVPPLATAVVLNGILYFLFWRGSHGLFLRAMAVIVALMGVCFLATMFLVIPGPVELVQSLKPAMPTQSTAHLVLAAMVGTTMASVCVVTRSYLVSERGWGPKDLIEENRDAMVSLSLTFLVSAAIMASAAGTMLPAGIPVVHAIDMVKTLEPLAGPFATALFVTGIVAAAVSSLFPNYLLGPWLVCDYMNVPRKMDQRLVRFRCITGVCGPRFRWPSRLDHDRFAGSQHGDHAIADRALDDLAESFESHRRLQEPNGTERWPDHHAGFCIAGLLLRRGGAGGQYPRNPLNAGGVMTRGRKTFFLDTAAHSVRHTNAHSGTRLGA